MKKALNIVFFIFLTMAITNVYFGPWFPPGSWMFFEDPFNENQEALETLVGLAILLLYGAIIFRMAQRIFKVKNKFIVS